MTGPGDYQRALDTAGRLLGRPLVLPLGDGEPPVGEDFRRLATVHTRSPWRYSPKNKEARPGRPGRAVPGTLGGSGVTGR